MMTMPLVLLLSLVACSHNSKSPAPAPSSAQQTQIEQLRQQLNRQIGQVEKLRSENERLQLQLRQQSPADLGESETSNLPTPSRQAPEESALFQTFLGAHKGRRWQNATRAFQMLEKTYPQSPLLAEAIYIRGKYAIQQKSYKTALEQMNRLIEEFPQHNRVRSAMLAKAVIYRRLNLLNPSKLVLQDLLQRYPKTEEAKKAQSHLSLLLKEEV